MSHTQAVDAVIYQTIEEVTGNPLSDIRVDADLVEDLGVSAGELAKIINKVQHKLDFVITEDAKLELYDNAETVGDLVDIIEEEYEF